MTWQGISIAPVHFEIIIRQMFSQLRIKSPGDAPYTEGELVEFSELANVNEKLEAEGREVIKAEDTVSGNYKHYRFS